jgi:hypothetical protein
MVKVFIDKSDVVQQGGRALELGLLICMTILRVCESRTGFQELLRAPRQPTLFERGRFGEGKTNRSKPLLLHFFAAVRRGVKPRRQPRIEAAVSATLVI